MTLLSVVGYILFIIGGVLSLRSQIPKQTILNQKDLIETLQAQRLADKEDADRRIKSLEDQRELDRSQHTENVKAIASLQGQLTTYKELPLKDMADAMKEISRVNQLIARSNREILATLKSSAVIAADDRIETQTKNL